MQIFGFVMTVGMIVALALTQSIAFAEQTKSSATQPAPVPGLTPKDVVKTILDALGNNDARDSGIKITWSFASPSNKKATGPLQRFIPMVKSPAYGSLINHRSAEVREIVVNDDQAAELVVVTDPNGDKAYFLFQLSKQTEGDCKDCWMTDGVVRVEPPNAPAAPVKPAPPRPDGQMPA